MAHLVIPDSIKPRDGRFGSGPSKVRPEQLAALAGSAVLGTSHRQAPVKDMVARIQARLADLFSLPEGYRVVLGVGGSTTFWDIAVHGLIAERSQHCVFGEFGAKFADAAAGAPFLATPSVRNADYGSVALPAIEDGVDVYAWPHNETSTGVAAPVARMAADGALTVVDGTSAAAGLLVDPTQFDVYYFAPQKGFGSDGGLWFALMSPAALERVGQVASLGRYTPASLDLAAAVANSAQHQTLNTPGLATLQLMDAQLEWMCDSGGLEFTAGRSAASAVRLYSWAEASEAASPFVADPALRSPVVGTIDFHDEIDTAALASALRANGLVDTEPYRKLGRNQLRIAMFPAIDPDDVSALTTCIDYLIERL